MRFSKKGKKTPHSDILCRDEDIKLETNAIQHKAAVFKAPKGWKDITESALKQTSLKQELFVEHMNVSFRTSQKKGPL